ncbi:MAG TPA: LptF/LptG family permease [Candidatus Azoamicus sp. OHIO1]
MILRKYIIKEILIIFFSIFFILLIILLSLQFNKLLLYEQNNLSSFDILFKIIYLSIPELCIKVISFVYFVSIIIFFYKFNYSNELAIIYLSGYSRFFVFQCLMFLSIFISMLIFIFVMFINPYFSEKLNYNINYYKSDIDRIKKLTFNVFNDGSIVLFFNDKYKKNLFNIFISFNEEDLSKFNLILSKTGNFEYIYENEFMFLLKDGVNYCGLVDSNDFQLIKFNEFLKVFKIKTIVKDILNSKNVIMLLKSSFKEDKIELKFRISTFMSFIFLSIIAIQLSFMNFEYSFFFNIINGILLCFIYSNLLIILKKFNGSFYFLNFLNIHGFFIFLSFIIFVYSFKKNKISL